VKFFIVFLVGLLMWIPVPSARAAGRVAEVRLDGVNRVDDDAVRVQITTAVGDPVDPQAIDTDIKGIYSLGFFDRVWVTSESSTDGEILTYHVRERPYVEEILFDGVEAVTPDDLEAVINVRRRTIFDPEKAAEGLQEAKKYYAAQGYADAKIDFTVEKYGDNQARVHYKVKEGELIHIREIRFEGVRAFKVSKLRKLMSTKKHWMFSFLTGAGVLNKDELTADVGKLSAFYYDKGYINIRIDKPEITREKDGLVVTIKVDEGSQFHVGEVTFIGDVLMDKADLARISATKSGDVFSASHLREAIFAMVEAYGNLGYAFAEVVPLTNIDAKHATVDIAFRFKSKTVVTVRRILIRGNTKTRDYVIRRELPLQEGKQFTGSGLRQARENIERLGFFSKVNLTTNRTDKDDQVDLLVDVEEGRTGTFSAGAGFSSADNFILNARIQERNLFGRGQSLVANTDFGSVRQNIQLSLTEPWFGGIPLSVGGDLFRWDLNFNDFTRGGTGFAARASYPLSNLGYKKLFGLSLDRVRTGLEYRLERSQIDGISLSAPESIKLEEGSRLTSSISPRVTRSTLNHPFDPTHGSRQVASAEFAGFGGETDFLKLEFSGRWFLPFYETKAGHDLVYSFGVTFGYGLGDSGVGGKELPLFERYFPGGINSLRGFDTRSLGPKEDFIDSNGSKVRRETVGGSQQLILNNDMIFPVLPSAGLKGVLFFDTGNAFSAQEGIQLAQMRLSAGFGARWLSPFGPLRVAIGFPLDRQADESSSVLLFSFGAPF